MAIWDNPFFYVAVVFVVAAAIYKLIGPRGQKVYLEIYGLNKNVLIRLNPKAATLAWIKDNDGIKELYVPKKYKGDTKGIQVPNSKDYIPNYNGVKLLKVLIRNNGEVRLLDHSMVINKEEFMSDYKVIDQDISFWQANQIRRAQETYKTESTWDKIKPFAMLGMVMITAIIILYFTVDKVTDMAADAAGERRETVNLIQGFLDRNKPNEESNSDQIIETDVPAPPGGGG